MNIRKLRHWVLALLLLIPVVALAQSGGPYDLSWWTVDGGAGISSGGAYIMAGSLGQPDAGSARSEFYTLASGFWRGGQLAREAETVFLPLLQR